MSLLDQVQKSRGETQQTSTTTSSGSSLLKSVQSARGESKVSTQSATPTPTPQKENLLTRTQGFLQNIGFKQQQSGKSFIANARSPKVKPVKLPSGLNLTFTKQKTDFDLALAQEKTSAKLTPEVKSKVLHFFDDDVIAERRRKIKEEVIDSARDVKPGYKEPGLFGSIIESIKESTVSMISGLGGTLEMVSNMTNSISLTTVGQKMQLEAEKMLASNPEWREEEDAKWGVKKVTRLVAGVVPSLLGVIGASFVAGAPGGLTFAFTMEAGSPYKEALEAGKTEEEARTVGILVGSVNAILERIFPSKILNKQKIATEVVPELSKSITKRVVAMASKFGIKFGKNGLLEGSTEALQEFWANVIAQSYDEDRSLWQGLLEAFVGGFGAGGIVGTAIEPGEYTPQEVLDKTISTPLQDTPEGKLLVKSAIEAEQKGQDITIEDPKSPKNELKSTIQNYVKDSGVFTDPQGKPVETPALKELTQKSNDPEVVKITQEQVEAIPKNQDGTITLYRGGKVSDQAIGENPDRLVSAAYTRESAENFIDKKEGDTSKLTEFKVKPEDIKVFIGGAEAEVLVKGSSLEGITPEAKPVKPPKTGSELLDYYDSQDQATVQQAIYETVGELDIAEAGQRLFGEDNEFIGATNSTFPQWIPSELRNKKLINSVLQDISTMKFPPNSQPKKQALYEEILSEIDSRAGTDSSDIINQIKEQDVKVIKKTKETKAKVKEKEKPKETSDRGVKGSEKVKTKVVPRSQVPVGEGKTKVSRLEARIKQALGELSEEQIKDMGLATFNEMNKKENIAKASKYVSENPEDALRVLEGKIDAPEGILRNSILIAMQNLDIQDLDIATRLATLQSTRAGQEISVLTEVNKNLPVNILSDIIKVRTQALEKQYAGKKTKSIVKAKVKKGKSMIKAKMNWDAILQEVRC